MSNLLESYDLQFLCKGLSSPKNMSRSSEHSVTHDSSGINNSITYVVIGE